MTDNKTSKQSTEARVMNSKHISFAFAAVAVATLLAGCTKNSIEGSGEIEEPSNSGNPTDLELAYVGFKETKAALDGTEFPLDGEIGLFLFEDEDATKAYGTGYENIKYSYDSGKKKWTADPAIKVGGETGYLYGYYPYSGTATNIKAIPVKSTLNEDDVMYATKQTVTSQNANQATITMNHALARVAITVKNNGYTGEARLSQIKFAGAKIAGSGTLDATSGSITATTADVTLAVPSGNQTITSEGTVFECLLVPSGKDKSKQTVTLSLTIDGQVKTVTLKDDNGVIIAQNTKSNITLTLSNTGLSVSSVSIDDWNVAVFSLKDALPGVFTVAADGQGNPTKKVRFSKGNLQATYNSSTGKYTFGFAEKQYDFIGGKDSNGTGEQTGNNTIDNQTDGAVVDLFGWSTSKTYYGINTSTTDTAYSGDFVDWGKNIGDGNTLRTLTAEEWRYLINENGDENVRKDKYKNCVTVCGKTNCLVLAPDDFTGTIEASYDADAWAAAEAWGLVCLPAAGYREGDAVDDVDNYGGYWSSSAYDGDLAYGCYWAYDIFLGSDEFSTYSRSYVYYGFSVRLITECQ